MSNANVVSPSDDRSGFDAVVMRYRCGWCGRPTLEDGTPIPLIEVGLIDDVDEEYKDAEKVNGGCCG